MNIELIKKIVATIIGIALIILFLYIFFYVALFFILIGLIAYIYYKFFKKKTFNKKENQYTKIFF